MTRYIHSILLKDTNTLNKILLRTSKNSEVNLRYLNVLFLIRNIHRGISRFISVGTKNIAQHIMCSFRMNKAT